NFQTSAPSGMVLFAPPDTVWQDGLTRSTQRSEPVISRPGHVQRGTTRCDLALYRRSERNCRFCKESPSQNRKTATKLRCSCPRVPRIVVGTTIALCVRLSPIGTVVPEPEKSIGPCNFVVYKRPLACILGGKEFVAWEPTGFRTGVARCR